MSLSIEEINAAEKMHNFVRDYEKRRSSTVASLGISFSIGISFAIRLMTTHPTPGKYYSTFGGFLLGLILGCFWMIALALWERKKQYEQACTLLKLLEREHLDELPWVKEEKIEAEVKEHLTVVKRLEQELANRRVAP